MLLGRYRLGSFLLAVTLTLIAGLYVLFTHVAKTRQTRFKLAAIVLSTGLSLVGIEAVFYWLDLWPPNPFYNEYDSLSKAPDHRLRYKRPAGLYWEGVSPGDMGYGDPFAQRVVFQTDSDGFRNPQDQPTADLVFLGDSFTEAGNVADEQTFAALTAASLGRSSVNLAVAGYGPLEEVAALEFHGLSRRPKWVVWQIFEGNDLGDTINYLYWQKLKEQQQAESPARQRWKRRLDRWKRSSPMLQAVQRIEGSPDSQHFLFQGEFRQSNGTTVPMRFRIVPSKHTHPDFDPIRWQALANALLAGKRLRDQNDIRLLVLHAPIKLRVMGPATRFGPNRSPGRDVLEKMKHPSELSVALKSRCQAIGVEFMDVTVSLREQARAGEVIYFPFDTHLAPDGHRRVAELISKRIQEVEARVE